MTHRVPEQHEGGTPIGGQRRRVDHDVAPAERSEVPDPGHREPGAEVTPSLLQADDAAGQRREDEQAQPRWRPDEDEAGADGRRDRHADQPDAPTSGDLLGADVAGAGLIAGGALGILDLHGHLSGRSTASAARSP